MDKERLPVESDLRSGPNRVPHLPRGVELEYTFRPSGEIGRLSWSADGRIQSLMTTDPKFRLWRAETWSKFRTVNSDPATLRSAALDPIAGILAIPGEGHTLELRNSTTGQLVRSLKGHRDTVRSIAFSPDGRTLASAGDDKTIRIWASESGRLLLSLEGHTQLVSHVLFSPDGRLIASKSDDRTLRLWRKTEGTCVAVIRESSRGDRLIGLAFHPDLPLLASVNSDTSTPPMRADPIVNVWRLTYNLLLPTTGTAAVAYASAKIVLVGDSGVGKTGLGWHLAHGAFREHASTHGQQFWALSQLSARRHDNTDCEAILWDLAGQPDYRLIHALFLDDADLALILFDATDSRDPFHGVEFWLKQLQIGEATTPAILVAARSDRGSATVTHQELAQFCERRGIRGGFIRTSARDGEGITELIEEMKALIPWHEKPATVTTSTFKYVKDYVLKLKENRSGGDLIVSPKELRRRLEESGSDLQFTDAEMMTAVGHLETHGYVKRLRTSNNEIRILLAPELLNNLAASCVLEARRNPKGLGSLEEKRLLDGRYPLRELDGLSDAERNILLDSVAVLFLKHNVAFRETNPLVAESYLVFPDLINLKKPTVDDEQRTRDGVAYTVLGAVENVYASLVVLLGYTNTFTRTEQWHNQARYEVGDGLLCGFRLEAERDGELDFVLHFGIDVPARVQMLFQSLFENFLARRNLTVFRYDPVTCGKCGFALERTVVRAKSREGKGFAFCNDCGERLTLPKTDAPIQLTREQQVEVDDQRRTADLRTRFEQALFSLQGHVKDRRIPIPECFISYAWGEALYERWVEKTLAVDLQKAGLRLLFDRWDNAIGSSVSRFVDRVLTCDRVVIVGTPLYKTKYQNGDPMGGFVVAAEGDMIGKRLIGSETEKLAILPLLLAGTESSSFPPLLQGRVYADFRSPESYFVTAFNLILTLYGISTRDPIVAEYRDSLLP